MKCWIHSRAGAVTHSKLAKGALSAANVALNSLTGSQIKASTLGTVPSSGHASSADSATNASHATNADAATNASHATSADSATSAGTATTAQGLNAPEAVHIVGAAGEPGFQNSWQDTGGSADDPVGFYKDHEGIVHLQGVAVGGVGSGNPIFQLPAGYRPAVGKQLRFAVSLCDCLETLTDPQGGFIFPIEETGELGMYGSGSPSAAFDGAVFLGNNNYFPAGSRVSLEGVTFRAAS
jgi:hypothetical protein